MEHSKPENQLLSTKNDLILVGLGVISLFLLNWQIQMKFMEIIAGIILVLASGYGLSMLFFSRKKDISLLNRLIITPIFGIFFTGLWSIIINYTPYHNSNIYYELAVIPVLFLILIIRLREFLKSRSTLDASGGNKVETQIKTKKVKTDQKLTTAQIAAQAEKAKLMQINEKNKKSMQMNQIKTPESSTSSTKQQSSTMPRPSRKKSRADDREYNYINKKNSAQKSTPKSKWAFKSEKTSKSENSSPGNIEIIKIRNSSKDLLIILFLTILSALFIFFPALKTSLIKIPFILMLIFFIPGYSVLCAIFVNFADSGTFKKLISSVLLSIGLAMGLLLSITFLKIQFSSSYILATLLIISTIMSIIGYLRRSKNQKKLKQGFNYHHPPKISEKSELNILTASQARESSKNHFNNNYNKNSPGTLSNEYADPEPLKTQNIPPEDFKEKFWPLEELKTQKSPIPMENESNKIVLKDNGSENTQNILTPSDAKRRVMSRKKARENLKKQDNKNKSNKVKSQLKSPEINLKRAESIKTSKKAESYEESIVNGSNRILSPFKVITVILLSLTGLFLTLPIIGSFIPSFAIGPVQFNSELIKLIFLIPILLYLPGYAIKELFIPHKYSGIIFTTGICVVLSLSLDIIIGFVLLYLGHFFTQISVTQSLYVGILSLISLSSILIAYWQSHRNKHMDRIDRDKKDHTPDSSKSIFSLKDSPEKDIERDNKPFFKINEEKTLITRSIEEEKREKRANKEINPLMNFSNKNKNNKKEISGENKALLAENQPKDIFPGKKPLKTMYMEEELEKSFPSSDYFKEGLSNNSKNISSKSPDLTPKRNPMATDLLIILLITFLTLVSIYVPIISETPLREISGLLFVIFIPGYVLIAALFPKKHDLNIIERLALSIGLSVAISPLIGLALNYTPFGIKLTPIVVALTGFTIIMLIIAYIQRRKVAEEDRFQPNFSGYLYSLKKSFDKESKMDKVLSIILILTLVLAIATTAYIIVKPKEGEKFTEFYVLGPNGKASDYPTNLTLGQSGKIFVGVVNHEYSTVNYEFVVKLQGKILSSEKLTLKNNQKWEKAVIFTPDQSGSKQKLEFILYKLPDNKKPYRSLHLWVNVV